MSTEGYREIIREGIKLGVIEPGPGEAAIYHSGRYEQVGEALARKYKPFWGIDSAMPGPAKDLLRAVRKEWLEASKAAAMYETRAYIESKMAKVPLKWNTIDIPQEP